MEIADHEQFVCSRHYLFFFRGGKYMVLDSFVTTIAIYAICIHSVNMNRTCYRYIDSDHLLQKLTTLLAAI